MLLSWRVLLTLLLAAGDEAASEPQKNAALSLDVGGTDHTPRSGSRGHSLHDSAIGGARPTHTPAQRMPRRIHKRSKREHNIAVGRDSGGALFHYFPKPVSVSAKQQPTKSRPSSSVAESMTQFQRSRNSPARNSLHSSTSSLLLGAAMTRLLPGADMTPLLPGADMISLLPGVEMTPLLPGANMTPLLPVADMAPLLPGADITSLLPGVDMIPLLPGAVMAPLLPGADVTSILPGAATTHLLTGPAMTPPWPGAADMTPRLPGAGMTPGPLPASTLPDALLKTPPKDWMAKSRNDSTSNSKESQINFSPSGLFHNSITAATLTKQEDWPRKRPDKIRNLPKKIKFTIQRSLGRAAHNSGRSLKKNCSKSNKMHCNNMHFQIGSTATRPLENKAGKDTRNYSSKRSGTDILSQLRDQSGLQLQKRAIQKRDKASTGDEGSSKGVDDTAMGLDGASEQGSNPGNVNEESWNDYIDKLFDPEFDAEVQGNISAVVGQTIHMGCRVNNLGTKTVSWIRHADTHILTVGSSTYTSDHRFSTLHRQGTNEWTLQLRDPTVQDSGLYECQVSTKPVRAHVVNLSVVVPSAHIINAPELFIDEGSQLNLTCVVAPSPAMPEYIFWYHRGEVINYETDRRVNVSVRQDGQSTLCSLVVAKAALGHSGRYECAPSNAGMAAITVHIFKAEEPAAMQTSGSSIVNLACGLRAFTLLSLPLAMLARAWSSASRVMLQAVTNTMHSHINLRRVIERIPVYTNNVYTIVDCVYFYIRSKCVGYNINAFICVIDAALPFYSTINNLTVTLKNCINKSKTLKSKQSRTLFQSFIFRLLFTAIDLTCTLMVRILKNGLNSKLKNIV